MEEILQDNRFAHIVRDPQFRRIPRKERKVTIDRRFKAMFDDSRFKLKYSVDKRGRPTNATSSEDLKRYYELDSSSGSGDSCDEKETVKKEGKKGKLVNNSSKTSEKSGREKTLKKGKTSSAGFTVTSVKDKAKKLVEKQIVKPDFSKGCEVSDEGARSSDNDNENIINSVNEAGSGDSDNDFEIGDEDGSDGEPVQLSEKVKKRLQNMRVDYARGEGVLLTDSSSDESTDEEGAEDVDHGWGEFDGDADHTDEVTHRLALCNMDWDRVHADDLMVLFHSFLPKGGVIHSISVYPSEYGLRRMKEENEKGPQELRELKEMLEAQWRADEKKEKEERRRSKKKKEDEEEEEEVVEDEEEINDKEQNSDLSGKEDGKELDQVEEGSHYQMEALRQYQLNRLKYYYAVLVFNSPQTANAVYEVCDGREYESTSARLDLRFIPDDMTFEQEPRETCTQLPNFKKYEPLLFVNTALQQSKVHLTWDETDPRRKKLAAKLMEGKVDGIDENDLKVYLASSSGGEEEEEDEDDKEGAAAKYRALLDSIDNDEKQKKSDVDLEVTWGIELKEKIDKRLKEGAPEKLTPFQQMIQKKREKLKAKREARKMKHKQEENGEEKNDKNESASSEDDIPSDVDMNDSYFREEFENEEFKKPAKKEMKAKKNKKHKENEKEESDHEESERRKAELELLLMDEDDGRQHFSLKDLLVKDKKKKKKGKRRRMAEEQEDQKRQDNFQINAKDERFSALFTSHLYNIDPADPHYKKTEAMETLRKQKLNQRNPEEEVQKKIPKVESPGKNNLDPEISALVKNIKRKVQK